MSDIDKINAILKSNSDKSFVKRILHRDKYPVLNNPDGSFSTHSMAWGEADGRYFVYPTVLLDEDGTLKRFDADAAWGHVMKTGNFLEFSSPKEADWFSKNYKKVWR